MDTNDIRQLRLQLLENGWSPIRNRDKRTFMKDWPNAEITPEAIDLWSRKFKRDTATGLRIDGDLVAVDFDIDDAVAVKAIANAIFDRFPELGDPSAPLLQRMGKGAKEAWFVRCDESFSRLHSRAWTRPGECPDDGAHRVEIFGSARPRQFGAFGPHTITDDGEVVVRYRWLDRSPADTRQSELPAISKARLSELVDTVEQTLRALRWQPVPLSTSGENEVQHVHDLTDEMQFDLNTGERLSLLELRKQAGSVEGLRASASWLEGPIAKNRTRCLVSLTQSGQLAVWDSATGITHHEVQADQGRPVVTADMSALGQKMLEIGLVPPAPAPERRQEPSLSIDDDPRVTTKKLLEMYAHCANKSFNEVLRIVTNKVDDGMEISRFTRAMSKFNGVATVNGKEVVIKPAAGWIGSRTRIDVAGSVLRPDMPAPIFEEGGRKWINTYYRPVHDAAPEGEAAFDAFMEHLVPDPDERRYLLMMDAYKWVHPEVPGVTILMVAERQGAGRGTYFSMLHGVYGGYAVKLDSATMASGQGQGQYNDYLAGSLIATCDEVLVAGAASDKHRRYAYEQFKKNFETGAMMRRIIQKGRPNYDTMVFTAMRLATNHDDAMPVEADDRRLAHVTNGVPLIEAPTVKKAIDRYRPTGTFTPGFLSMLVRKWESIDLTGFRSDGPVPAFKGRTIMIEANRSEVDDMVADHLEKAVDYVNMTDLRGACGRDVTLGEIKQALKRLGWVKVEPGRSNVGDERTRAHVYARNEAAKRLWLEKSLLDRKSHLAKFRSPTEVLAARLNLTVVDGDKPDDDNN